ncbi:MAG: ribonuclease III domain-containing protein [Benniella sp.]|nr:MAG: ribonuclease III domain-containing protein [Benniella sp.]KAK3811972.1 MAG: ribonuclease III domain-containing protein [Benniella sp.]
MPKAERQQLSRKRERRQQRQAEIQQLPPTERKEMLVGRAMSKMVLAAYLFIMHPWAGPGPLTSKRNSRTMVMDDQIMISLGRTYLVHDLDWALDELRPICPLYGVRAWTDLVVHYQTSQPMVLGVDTIFPPKYRAVESVLGYKFTNKSLLMQALYPKGGLRPVESTLERLEYLGDAVLEVVALDFMRRHFPEDGKLATRVQMSVCNQVLQAACLETGLYKFVRVCSEDVGLEDDIAAAKASWKAAKQGFPKEAPWRQQHLCKTLADVVEALFGAVFLDCEMDMVRMGKVWDVLVWPIIHQTAVNSRGWLATASL